MKPTRSLMKFSVPFSDIPRRLRIGIISILTSQYRLTPVEKRKSRRLRIPNDPDFQLALQFLKVRCCVEPGLQKVWDEWNEAFSSPHRVAAKRRRRPRKNDGSPSRPKR